MPYRFGSFIFDGRRGLRNDGKPVPLEPQVFDLLSYLIDNRDRVVTKEELNKRIWNGRIVSDAALSTGIRSVRRALGDDRTQQKYIRTYPKRGFQFVGVVQEIDNEDIEFPTQARARPPGGTKFLALATFSVIIIAAISALWPGGNELRNVGSSPKLSIVVLPFENLSGDPEHDYFADAITEDLITDLSRIRDAFVIARRTSFTYKEEATDIATVADELGVRYVLEGSVRRSGDDVRINAQLIDGKTRGHVWSDRFDLELKDVFSVQNEVTGQIAAALKAELREAESDRQGPPASLAAWDYALKGNVLLFNPRGLEDFREAKALLERAVNLDPSISSAWSGLAFVHFVASLRPLPGISAPNSKNLSLDAAKTAVSIDPKNAEGHWMIGVGYARNGQPELGWASCETAIDLNPNNDCAYVCAGLTKMALGQPSEAIRHFERSLRLNPRFRPFVKYNYMGVAFLQSGQDAKAIEALNRSLAGSPTNPIANFALTSALALTGRVDAARAALKRSMKLAYSDRTTLATLRTGHSWMGPGFERVLNGLRIAGMPER